MTNVNYVSAVKASRDAARDILRGVKVSNLLGYIKAQKDIVARDIKNREEIVAKHKEFTEATKLAIAMEEYDLRVAEAHAHPKLEKIRERVNTIKDKYNIAIDTNDSNHAAKLANFDKEAALNSSGVEEKLNEYAAKITAWETGESKVDYEEMVALAQTLEANRVKQAYAETDPTNTVAPQ